MTLSTLYDAKYSLLSITLSTLASAPSNTTNTPSQSLHIWLLMTTWLALSAQRQILMHVIAEWHGEWRVTPPWRPHSHSWTWRLHWHCWTWDLAPALTVLNLESCTLTSEKQTLNIFRSLPEGSRLSPNLFDIFAANLIHELQTRRARVFGVQIRKDGKISETRVI